MRNTLPRELAEPGAERHVEALEDRSCGARRRRGRRASAPPSATLEYSRGSSAQDLEPPGAHRAPRRLGVPLRGARRRCRALLPQQHLRAPRAGRRAGWSPACTGSSRSCRWRASPPSPSTLRGSFARLRRRERLGQTQLKRQARRQHQALLRAGDGDVDAPLVVAVVDRGERRDRVDQQQRRMAGAHRSPCAPRRCALVTPVEVSLCTTQTALMRVPRVVARAAPRSRRDRRRGASRRRRTRPRGRAARPSSATASRSGRSRTSARGRPATAC